MQHLLVSIARGDPMIPFCRQPLLLMYTGDLNIAMKIRLCYFDAAGAFFHSLQLAGYAYENHFHFSLENKLQSLH
jgi:hypothetical protein